MRGNLYGSLVGTPRSSRPIEYFIVGLGGKNIYMIELQARFTDLMRVYACSIFYAKPFQMTVLPQPPTRMNIPMYDLALLTR